MRWGEVRGRPSDFDAVLGAAEAHASRTQSASVEPDRVRIDAGHGDQGLLQLALTVVELLRQLMERQAMRRIEAGSLTDAQAEKMGVALQGLQEQVQQLCRDHGIDELNLDLGPLGRLLD